MTRYSEYKGGAWVKNIKICQSANFYEGRRDISYYIGGLRLMLIDKDKNE